jgi:hypothetical protein
MKLKNGNDLEEIVLLSFFVYCYHLPVRDQIHYHLLVNLDRSLHASLKVVLGSVLIGVGL